MNPFLHSNYKDLNKLFSKVDSPFFLYDLDGLSSHLGYLKEQTKGTGIKLWYACKANPASPILKVFRNSGIGVDVASMGELDQALASGIRPKDILTTGPSKSPEYLEYILDNEVKIVVAESLNQVYWLNEKAKKLGKRPTVLLRVQLDWNKGGSILGGNSITPFGLGIKDWLKLKKEKTKYLNICGFHVFQWGNILDPLRLKKIWSIISEEMVTVARELNIKLKILDLGGGLGIPYNSKEVGIDFRIIKESLIEIKNRHNIPEIWMELGRYMVGPYGYFFNKVIDRKLVRGQNQLVLQSGINHLARSALTGQFFPCRGIKNNKKSLSTFHLYGPLCTALDYLGSFPLTQNTKIGDWLIFEQCGAYGFTEAMPYFLCHDLPSEVFKFENNFMIPRKTKDSSSWLI